MLFSLSTDELLAIQELCKQDIHACWVVTLYELFIQYPVVNSVRPILNDFAQLFEKCHSDITSKVWMQICQQDVANLQDLVERVWPIFIDRLQEMVVSMSQLTMPCGEAASLMPTGTAPQQLRNVVRGLKACHKPVADNINVDEVCSKVRLYDGLKALSKQAEQLLSVTRKFKLEGDFAIVVNIADVSSRAPHYC